MSKNRTTTPENILYTATKLLEILKSKYRMYDLTYKDLDDCFTKGIIGDYGEYYEISLADFCNWINHYIASDEYLKKFKKSNLKAIPMKASVTEHELLEQRINVIILHFKQFKETKQMPILTQLSCIDYDFLAKHELINNSIDAKNQAIEKAKKFFQQLKKQKRGYELVDFIKNVFEPKSYQERCIQFAKQYLLQEYYYKIISEKKEEKFVFLLKSVLKKT